MDPRPDQIFGKLAVEAGYLTDAQLKDLLAQQARDAAAGNDLPLGEVCRRRRLMSEEHVAEILIAQEFVEMHEEDKRFGARAVSRGMATAGQVQAGLDEQKRLFEAEKEARPLAEILQEAGVLDPGQVEALSLAQGGESGTKRETAPRPAPRPSPVTPAFPPAAPPAPLISPSGLRVPSAPAARLVIEAGEDAGSSVIFSDKAQIGRDATNEVVLKDVRASRQHARIEYDTTLGKHVLYDPSSRNGTFLNDVRVAEPVALKAGDLIRIGRTTLRYEPGAGISA